MNIIEQTRAFMEKAKDMTREAIREALEAVPEAVKNAYWDLRKAAYFTPENANVDQRKEHLSPSGKYKLVVTPFATSPGSWSYSQGLVYALGSDTAIAEVQRNYSAFPFLWVEGHKNGHDYLVCGADYQGQTVVELDTGKRRDFLPEDAKKGFGFCWVDYRYDERASLLLVCGCIWAAPYEYRFYDFADPMSDWQELEVEECIDADQQWPVVQDDGTIRCVETLRTDDDDDDEDEDAKKDKPPPVECAVTTLRREKDKLVIASQWVSDEEKARRQKAEESRIRYEKEIAEFRATDPLYLAFTQLVKDPALSPESYESIGITHSSWCPHFKEEERRFCRRIITSKKPKVTVDLEWAAKTGPVKLVVYRDGKHVEDKFFDEHSVESLNAAVAYAKATCAVAT
jgi:hypothetical protein